MAEFKLGRIRFVWKADWATGTTYYKDDVIRYGGKTYICAVGHTSATEFYTDLDYVPTKWNLMTDGQEWRGDWDTDTFYKLNDLVKYGSLLYICKESHTSAATTVLGLEADQDLPAETASKWDLYAEGFNWLGAWTNTTRYKKNDLVKYGGITYVCNEGHTSASTDALGLEDDQSKWDEFNNGLEYKGAWSGSSVRYKLNDIVKQGAGLWICTTDHTSTASFITDAPSYWAQFVEGSEFENDWSSGATYQPGDIVRYGGNQYIATTNHTNSNPVTGTTNWDLYSEGLRFNSDWSDATSYKKGEVVRLNGYTYVATEDNLDSEPPSADWERLNSGIYWRGEWIDDIEYKLGDAVRFGANAYICILGHKSEGDDGSTIGNDPQGGGNANSRPDQDLTGTYWNLLSAGTETAVLTTRGDLVYYGGAGPTRLPVGLEGQVLRVGTDLEPEWVTLAETDQVYYVAPHGTNLPGPTHGRSLDKPWGSIRYACEQIDKGTRNSNAKRLLEMNRVFIQREVTSWIDYQIANDIAPFTTSFVYEDAKCERDTGFVVDALMHDISHGGNVKSRGCALAYVNAITLDSPGVYTKLAAETDEDVAAFTYMLEIVEAVLSNTAPATVYQNITDDSVTIATQFIDTALIAEAGVMSDITVLVGIITDAITAGVATNIPAREVPPKTIFIKAGQYRETLPIMIPESTTLFGDDKRSVNAGPAGSLVDATDTQYSVAAIGHLEDIVGAIITGAAVTPTTGNTEVQSSEWPFADTAEVEAATKLTQLMQYNADFRLGTTHMMSYPNPDGFDAAFGRSRTLIAANKAFFKQQVKAYIDANYPGLTYSRTSCLRDAGYIVDAQIYDLTYGGNAQSVVAGLAYYQGVGSSLYIDSTELAATLASYNYLKSMMQEVAVNATVTAIQSVEVQVSGTAGSAGAATAIGNNMDEIIDIITNGPSAVTLTDPSTAWVASGLTTDYSAINSAVSEIQVATIDYINTNFGSFTYDSSKCRRDTGIILDGVYYDVALGTNYNAVTNGSSYRRAMASEVISDQIDETTGAIYYAESQAAASLVSNSTSVTRSNAAFTEIIDIISNGVASADALTFSDPGVDSNKLYARQQLQTNKAFIQQELIDWIDSQIAGNIAPFSTSYTYDSDVCFRDTGLIVDALSYDVQYGGNTATRVAAQAYFEGAVSVLPTAQKTATAAAMAQLASIVSDIVTESYAGQDTGGTAASATEATQVDGLVQIIEDVITADTLSGLPAASYPSITWVDSGIQAAVTQLASDKTDIVAATLQYITNTYSSLVYDHAKCSRDVATILKAVGYDFMFNANFQTVKAAYAYLRATATEVFSLGQKTATRAALTYVRDLALAEMVDTTAEARLTNLMDILDTVLFSGSMEGTNCATGARNRDYAALQLERNREFIVAEVSAWIADTYPSYTYSISQCERDVNTYIDALKYDLKYPGNYKSMLAVRYYANAVLGSLEEDMYYTRNSTSIRNMTLEGLSGDLTPENAYGTRRVTAGAYVSLDPGWGPDDYRTWIMTRSPYIQNLATFGNACIGQKIDGALHNGGNDSMVSNDFTQLISDGIGAWVTNNGRAELVSVFTYYSYIGYLSTDGGRIRGTNGNNSYGTFGSIAEGYDATEVPNTATIDNRGQFDAVVGYVFTDSANQIYAYEFDNAGTDYTELTWISSGAGSGALTEATEFRDDAVFEVRLLDNVDDSTEAPEADGNFGGFGYISNANTAQGGTSTQITIAATDAELSTAYVGMKIYLTGGTGVGQVGIIATYNSGTKVATVTKESTGAAGWDHIVPGTTIQSPDASTTYTIEPRVTLTGPSYATTAKTLPDAAWVDAAYSEVFAGYPSATGLTNGAGSGATFSVTRKGTKYFVEIIGGGTGYSRLDTITLAGANLGGVTSVNDVVITVLSINTVNGAVTAIDFEGRAAGGNFVAIATGTDAIATSPDADTWTSVAAALPSSTTWTAVASGKLTAVETAGAFVVGRSYTIVDPGTTTNWPTIGASGPSIGTRFVATGVGNGDGTATPNAAAIVAVGTDVAAYSMDGGETWESPTTPIGTGNWTAVAYGAGKWVAITSDTNAVAYSADGGNNWIDGGNLPSSTTWTGVAYGGGKWVAVASGGVAAAYVSNLDLAWTSVNLPATSNWSSVTHGNNRFVAVSSSTGTDAAFSLDGITWTASTITSASYRGVRYGQGVFLAVGGSTQAASSEDGVVWTSRTTSTAANGFSVAVFGNPNSSGKWAAVQRGASGTVASLITLGAKARARAYVSQNKIYSIKITEPGSGYSSAPTLTITDPSNIYEAPFAVRIGKGAVATPNFKNRGTGYTASAADIDQGDGYGDFFQSGQYIAVNRLTQRPVAGSNVVFSHLPDQTFKLVNVLTFLGTEDGSYSCFFQISPTMKLSDAPAHGTALNTRIRYSQVRLTGHDFLNVGTGGFDTTNYPNIPFIEPVQANETVENNGGRVFFTSTDQDGNFRVGDLFTIEQSTGVATLNADAFNIAGLQELSLGNIQLGGGSASITEFSTDPFFTLNSDTVVPTQRAIKAYIASQIGGGGASLNVNSVTAGFIYIANNQITTTTGGIIKMQAKFDFQGPVTGLPLAFNYFLN